MSILLTFPSEPSPAPVLFAHGLRPWQGCPLCPCSMLLFALFVKLQIAQTVQQAVSKGCVSPDYPHRVCLHCSAELLSITASSRTELGSVGYEEHVLWLVGTVCLSVSWRQHTPWAVFYLEPCKLSARNSLIWVRILTRSWLPNWQREIEVG